MRFLFLSLALFFALSVEAQQPTGRRKHTMSRAFTEFKGENCFQITRQEADQAFRGRSWDDAAALYRAAKSCADADQAGRSEMNIRIRACRDAAEQELLDKEAAARRQARQAIASNRADDAQDLLKNFDRGLAYRLADFANQYIAPPGEPNADCLQATFDAWYYIPQKQTNLEAQFDLLRVPFCYQLPQESSAAKLLQFGGQGFAAKLYQLTPSEHLFRSWDASTLRPDRPISVDTAFHQFHVSPDGRTIAFCGPTVFAFWQNGREMFRQEVTKHGAFAFSTDSNAFYYYDGEEKKVMQLDLRLKYVAQQRKSNTTNVLKPPIPVPYASGLAQEPLALAVLDNQLWFGYRDSVVICQKKGDGTPWQRVRVAIFAAPKDSSGSTILSEIRLFPQQESVLIINELSSNFYKIPTQPGRYDALLAHTNFPYGLIGAAPDASLMAETIQSNDGRGNKVYLIDPATQVFHYGAFTQPEDYFTGLQGAFSPDGQWFAAANSLGVVKLWALSDRQSEPIISYGEAPESVKLSPNAQRTFLETEDKVEVYSIAKHELEWTLATPQKNPASLVLADQWLAYSTSDSLIIASPDYRKRLAFPLTSSYPASTVAVAFDPSGQYVAYTLTSDSVVVRRLPDGVLQARRAFSGSIKSLIFIPDKNTLAVVAQSNNGYATWQQNVVKIWDFTTTAATLPTVRLHDYAIEKVIVSPLGDRIAFSDAQTVRIFDLDKLADEQASIRAFSNKIINSLVFQPDGRALAAGYDDGTIIFWDTQNGQATFEFKNAGETWSNVIVEMAFAQTGQHLRYLNSSHNLFDRQLDPDTIRAIAQTTYKQLAAFSPQQISQYNLEPMLSYDLNFEALASSGDGPLIRSFFDFYQEQALASNNIEQVGIYCQRAFELYKRLDQDFQTTQRSTMIALYEDYSWKWLLRNNTTKSAQLVTDMNRYFGKPIEATRAGAFTALLNNDLPAATRLFVAWMADEYTMDNVSMGMGMNILPNRVRQLIDYDLLTPNQLGYLCALFGEITDLDKRMCEKGTLNVAIPFDPESELRWRILLDLSRAKRTNKHAQAIRYLESALANSQTLVRRNPKARLEVEKTKLALAERYIAWGYFEQNTPRAADLYRRASETLVSRVIFTDKIREAYRQNLLGSSYLALGDYLLAANRTQEAFDTYGIGINMMDGPVNLSLEEAVPEVEATLYVQRATAALFLGKISDARTDFEVAAEKLKSGLNSFYFGPVALLEGQEAEALTQYEGIADENTLSRARFDLERLAESQPVQRTRIEQFIPAMQTAVVARYRTLDTLYVGYLLANLRRQHFSDLGQWSAALTETERSLRYAERALNADDKSYFWQERWLDALLNESYQLLLARPQDQEALSRGIRYAEQAEKYVSESATYYSNAAYLKTNHAHALILRDAPGDRAQAIALYHGFLANDLDRNDSWEVLYKDFRDLHVAGAQWPRLRELIEEIKPADVELSAEDWLELGIIQ